MQWQFLLHVIWTFLQISFFKVISNDMKNDYRVRHSVCDMLPPVFGCSWWLASFRSLTSRWAFHCGVSCDKRGQLAHLEVDNGQRILKAFVSTIEDVASVCMTGVALPSNHFSYWDQSSRSKKPKPLMTACATGVGFILLVRRGISLRDFKSHQLYECVPAGPPWLVE